MGAPSLSGSMNMSLIDFFGETVVSSSLKEKIKTTVINNLSSYFFIEIPVSIPEPFFNIRHSYPRMH